VFPGRPSKLTYRARRGSRRPRFRIDELSAFFAELGWHPKEKRFRFRPAIASRLRARPGSAERRTLPERSRNRTQTRDQTSFDTSGTRAQSVAAFLVARARASRPVTHDRGPEPMRILDRTRGSPVKMETLALGATVLTTGAISSR
jgi:hypothetical protein